MKHTNAPTPVRLAGIVKQRGQQQIRVIVTGLNEQPVDTQMVGAIERAQALKKAPLCIGCQPSPDFVIDSRIGPAEDCLPKLAHAPEHATHPAAPGA